MKTLHLLLLFAFVPFIGATQEKFEAQFEEMYSFFPEVPKEMTNEQFRKYALSGAKELTKEYKDLLEIDDWSDGSTYHAIGKFEKGKNVTFLYIEVRENDDPDLALITMEAKTLHSKKLEIDNSQHYILSSGQDGNVIREGSFKRDGEGFIEFYESEVNEKGETKSSGKRYEMEKYLAFDAHLE